MLVGNPQTLQTISITLTDATEHLLWARFSSYCHLLEWRCSSATLHPNLHQSLVETFEAEKVKRAPTGAAKFHGICVTIFTNLCEQDWPQGGVLPNITNLVDNHIVN